MKSDTQGCLWSLSKHRHILQSTWLSTRHSTRHTLESLLISVPCPANVGQKIWVSRPLIGWESKMADICINIAEICYKLLKEVCYFYYFAICYILNRVRLILPVHLLYRPRSGIEFLYYYYYCIFFFISEFHAFPVYLLYRPRSGCWVLQYLPKCLHVDADF